MSADQRAGLVLAIAEHLRSPRLPAAQLGIEPESDGEPDEIVMPIGWFDKRSGSPRDAVRAAIAKATAST